MRRGNDRPRPRAIVGVLAPIIPRCVRSAISNPQSTIVTRRFRSAFFGRHPGITLPGPQRDATAAGSVVPPLVGEPTLVRLQEGLGVDAVADERPAAEAVDEQVACHGEVDLW
jgi:hypothetical protein